MAKTNVAVDDLRRRLKEPKADAVICWIGRYRPILIETNELSDNDAAIELNRRQIETPNELLNGPQHPTGAWDAQTVHSATPGRSNADTVTALIKSRDQLLDPQDGPCHGAPANPTPPGSMNCHTNGIRVGGPLLIAGAAYTDAARANDQTGECSALQRMMQGEIQLMNFSSNPYCLRATLAAQPNFKKNQQTFLDNVKGRIAETCH